MKLLFFVWPRPNLRFSASAQRAAALGAFQEYSIAELQGRRDFAKRNSQIEPLAFAFTGLTIEAAVLKLKTIFNFRIKRDADVYKIHF